MTNTATAKITFHRNPLWDVMDALPSGSLLAVCIASLVLLVVAGALWFFRPKDPH